MTPPDRSVVAAAVRARQEWAVVTLTGWVRLASVLGAEQPAQDYAASLYERLGLAVRREAIDVDAIRDLPGFGPVDWSYEGRYNVVGLHDPGANEARTLVVNGHVDVVSPEPLALWSSPPFEPRLIEDGPDGETWLTGRGAGDMKGGSVACLWAFAALADLGVAPASRVVFESPIEEECTGNGTLALCAAGYGGDACLIPEPFDETVLVRQMGVLWFRVRVLGKTAHVLGAGRGVNAIEKSWRFVRALRDLEDELNRPERIPAGYRGMDHPLNLNPGVIQGGDWASTVAGECVIHFRLGVYPGEPLDEARRTVERRVADAAAGDPFLEEFPPRVEWIGFQAEGCEFDPASAFGRSLTAAHAAWRGRPAQKLAATCTTDVRHFERYYGTPATCYGPKAADIHGADERVSVDSMRRVAEVTATFLMDWCGARSRG